MLSSFSFSAANTVRTCEQRYAYSYIDLLRPKVESAAPLIGRMMHNYFEVFYKSIFERANPAKAHARAFETFDEEEEKVKQLAWIASGLGENEVAAELSASIPQVRDLAAAYFRVRGRDDAKAHDILHVEERFEVPLWNDGPVLPARIDLVTRDKDGWVHLWEHKTTRSIPRIGTRLIDLQTTIYNAVMQDRLGLTADFVTWNYINTKKLFRPELMKRGGLTQRKNLHTTVDIYTQAINDSGLKVQDYQLTLEQIALMEQEDIFQRFELPLQKDEHLLLNDLVRTARRTEKMFSNSEYKPIRNVGRDCGYCPYAKMCEAAILGYDVDEVRQRYFTQEEQRHGTSHDADEEAALAALLDA